MADLLMNYLRRNPRVQGNSYAATTTQTQVLPRDPMRYALSIPSDSVNTIYYWLGNDGGSHAFNSLVPGAPPVLIYEDWHGGYVTDPLWIFASAPCPALSFLTYSYEPREFALYQRFQHDIISKFESPRTHP